VQQYRRAEPELKKGEEEELDELGQQLEDRADAIEAIDFPGMYG
jgi:hypothetical protein